MNGGMNIASRILVDLSRLVMVCSYGMRGYDDVIVSTEIVACFLVVAEITHPPGL